METFPIRPLFDRVIVREIPIEDYYEQGEIKIDLDNAHIKERSDRGVVVAAGRTVEEVQVGDIVQFDEYCLSDPIYLNPAHKNRHDLPKYWQIRVHDLKGVREPEEEPEAGGIVYYDGTVDEETGALLPTLMIAQ